MIYPETGVNVEVLKKDAAYLGILDLDHESIFSLGRRCDEKNRNPSVLYPSKSDYLRYNVYLNGIVLGTSLSKEEMEKMKIAYPKSIKEESPSLGYDEAKEAYTKYQSIVRQVFTWGLFYLTNTMHNPKATKAFSIAWDKGHSNGFEEVAGEFDTLLELIK